MGVQDMQILDLAAPVLQKAARLIHQDALPCNCGPWSLDPAFLAWCGEANRLQSSLASNGLRDLAACDASGHVGIHKAISAGDLLLCAEIFLRARPSELNARDACGETALHAAARHLPHVAMPLLSIPDFAMVNCTSRDGYTALHLAAAYGHKKLCAAILRHDDFCMAHAQTLRGFTALHCAAANDHGEVCRLLCSYYPILIHIQDSHGLTALEVARPRAFRVILGCQRDLCCGSIY
eukprot:TRINITY_DN110905_c0_g1_i1.p1 TRINITY_DN110905_c0_g1~~TRINITY_DN110905_c0_g1_i1.p1  ORF type:complete len:258 (+),score=31.87 TRINITY_DN110905_c0_g1_i1:65-775(+)